MVSPEIAEGLLARARRHTDTVLARLQSPDPKVRKRALFEIARLDDPRAVDALVEGLSDPDVDCRAVAASLLGKGGHLEAVVPLLGMLAEEPSVARRDAIEALGNIGSPEALPYLLKETTGPHCPEVIVALGKIGLSEATASVIEAIPECRSLSPSQRLLAVLCLGEERAAFLLEPELEQTDWIRKAEAAAALGKLGYRPAVPRLIALLDDENAQVRSAANKALMRISGKGFGPHSDRWTDWWDASSRQ